MILNLAYETEMPNAIYPIQFFYWRTIKLQIFFLHFNWHQKSQVETLLHLIFSTYVKKKLCIVPLKTLQIRLWLKIETLYPPKPSNPLPNPLPARTSRGSSHLIPIHCHLKLNWPYMWAPKCYILFVEIRTLRWFWSHC